MFSLEADIVDLEGKVVKLETPVIFDLLIYTAESPPK